mmetsp:Transcript_86070/g.240658  ORF Transcript_86070/g.240658 Transcript_86070/m.240658 type:complete len:295 (-) Transcript_86070:1567-2451(-)
MGKKKGQQNTPFALDHGAAPGARRASGRLARAAAHLARTECATTLRTKSSIRKQSPCESRRCCATGETMTRASISSRGTPLRCHLVAALLRLMRFLRNRLCLPLLDSPSARAGRAVFKSRAFAVVTFAALPACRSRKTSASSGGPQAPSASSVVVAAVPSLERGCSAGAGGRPSVSPAVSELAAPWRPESDLASGAWRVTHSVCSGDAAAAAGCWSHSSRRCSLRDVAAATSFVNSQAMSCKRVEAPLPNKMTCEDSSQTAGSWSSRIILLTIERASPSSISNMAANLESSRAW